MNDIPDWAGKRACELLNAEDRSGFNYGWPKDCDLNSVRTVAKLVMQHEQPPVDPDEEAVHRILSAWYEEPDFRHGVYANPGAFAAAVSQYKQELGARS